ncbi:hypothetical protein [Nocardiopsis sp. NRRL B-16309]|uniref:hypothetical protein n=1 Tax=Nocardiopsis sp. NRRL B-16309 TaxID=1519494 RepID=UPI0006AE23EE|nr:hypothetical protein [Nocardiopsis sp. NRRL B-16309]
MSDTTEGLLRLIRDEPGLAEKLTADMLVEIAREHADQPPADTKAELVPQVRALAERSEPVRGADELGEPVRVRVEGPVTTQRDARAETSNELLFAKIRERSAAISYGAYADFLSKAFCSEYGGEEADHSPYFGADAYAHLREATEKFLMCEVGTDDRGEHTRERNEESLARLAHHGFEDYAQLSREFRRQYLIDLAKEGEREARVLPYTRRIIEALGDLPLKTTLGSECYGIVRSRVSPPCLLELIWSYWQEQGMLVQTMQSVSLRFQNREVGPGHPLAHLEIDPLRPLNNLIWGYIQDEPRRLSVLRRTYEYDHQYGLRLRGKAVPALNPADSRRRFLEAFHDLLHLATIFFKEDDDTNYRADGFPILNALKELHLILAQGAHNQFGDLPWQARQEMLIMQWLLARPEMRDFLGGRAMVPYAEPWMGRVETMAALRGWHPAAGVTHFRDLAVFGEQILLSARQDDWVGASDVERASNWARFWRPEIQGYIHAYRAATGVDLSADAIDSAQTRMRYTEPSRLLAQRGNRSKQALT